LPDLTRVPRGTPLSSAGEPLTLTRKTSQQQHELDETEKSNGAKKYVEK
jgi:hypothetical protein